METTTMAARPRSLSLSSSSSSSKYHTAPTTHGRLEYPPTPSPTTTASTASTTASNSTTTSTTPLRAHPRPRRDPSMTPGSSTPVETTPSSTWWNYFYAARDPEAAAAAAPPVPEKHVTREVSVVADVARLAGAGMLWAVGCCGLCRGVRGEG
ncbi:hypothetical protein BZA05DRAFT_472468 [Tricharina praecox]|uniref:uncharacterized protein n=1 Tax=Tricharina praecox TaxID=43433 RepID=UPI00222063DA|nr:uncharacterized protein BZA05DRAFT_472468 [Tricharina praecox]KAI5854639.1 hypothetical protein BZA05DRAFT_472468 [Tricharina praecox]